jgi:hypothetical protein
MSTIKKANLHNLEGREKTRKKKAQTNHPPAADSNVAVLLTT